MGNRSDESLVAMGGSIEAVMATDIPTYVVVLFDDSDTPVHIFTVPQFVEVTRFASYVTHVEYELYSTLGHADARLDALRAGDPAMRDGFIESGRMTVAEALERLG